MKIVIRLVLFLMSLGLLFLLYSSIKEPILFQTHYDKRSKEVINKLKDIRKAQKYYRSITDTFAPSFESLEQVLANEKFEIIQVTGDRDAIDAEVHYDTIWVNANDSMKTIGLDYKNLRSVPNTDNKTFEMFSGMINQQGVDIPVVEVSATWKDFMGEYGDIKYAKYDQNYDPSEKIKFGSRTKANLSGNWE